MHFKIVNQLNGDHKTYRISPAVKAFTLMDTGFRHSNAGNYVLKRALGSLHGPRLKIVIRKDLKSFKMDVTDSRGLRKVNVFTHPQTAVMKQLTYLMDNLVIRRVLQCN